MSNRKSTDRASGRTRAWYGAIVVAACALAGAAEAGTIDRIKSDGAIRLAVRDDAPPFSARGTGPDPVGYSVELCRAVADSVKQQLGLTKLDIRYVKVTAADRLAAIQDGRADLLCEATTATLSRRKLVDFSITTFISGAGLLIRTDSPKTFAGLSGQKIGVLGNTTTETALRNTLKDQGMNAEVVLVKSHPEGVQALRSGAVSAYFADRTILTFLMRDEPPGQLLLADEYLTLEPYALALPHGDEDFRLAVDRALSELYRSNRINSIFADSFGKTARISELMKAMLAVSSLPE
jgi:ABC-type amino acid transport substrate-binding protein